MKAFIEKLITDTAKKGFENMGKTKPTVYVPDQEGLTKQIKDVVNIWETKKKRCRRGWW